MNLYPVNLNIQGKHCVVVGGGKIAARKLRGLIECDAKITVISPEICSEVEELIGQGRFQLVRRPFQPEDLSGAMVCIAATDNRQVQNMVRDAARKEKCLLNSIDDQEACDFQVPSKIRRGGLLLTVSTGGGSPALSKDIRIRLEDEFGSEYEEFVAFLATVREHLLAVKGAKGNLASIFHALVQPRYLELLADQDWTGLERCLTNDLPKDIDVAAMVQKIRMKL